MRRLYELAGENPALLFSPYCWRIRFALLHKGLAFESVPWHFTQGEAIAFSGQGRVPVLVDGERTVADSWAIARHLDEAYPDKPLNVRENLRFLNTWTDTVLHPAIARLVVRDILDVIPDFARPYFRASREKAFGATLEAVVEGREGRRAELRAVLDPVRRTLTMQDYLGGAGPDYADYIVAGSLMWPRCVSRFEVLDEDDPVSVWFSRIRALFDGAGNKAVRP